MKRIVMLLYKDIHFDARVQREAIGLAEQGEEVFILCLKEFNTEPPFLHKNIKIVRMSICSKKYKQQLLNEPKENKKLSVKQKALSRIIRSPVIKLIKDLYSYHEFYLKCRSWMKEQQQQWDVMHCHDLNTLKTGIKLAKEFQAQVVYDSHELFNEMSGRNKLDRWYGYRLEKKLLRDVDQLIVVNPYVAEEFKKQYGQLPEVTVIQNVPIYKEEDTCAIEDDYFRKKYRLKENDFLLIFQGGIDPHRGLEEILKAMELLPEHFKLVLVGNGRIKSDLEKAVLENGLANRVFFHEQVPASDILCYTKQADAGLVMYKNISRNNYFSTPNKIFEYLLAGIPAIASDHPGKSYIVKNEQTGICTEETPEQIAKAVLQIYENYDFYKNNCLQKREKYSWQKEKMKLVEMYRRL